MKKFILKFVFFCLLLGILFLLRDRIRSVHYLPVDEVQAKLQLLEKLETRPTSYFIGSSHTDRHYDPQIIDSITSSRSFNLGYSMLGVDSKIELTKLMINDGYIMPGDTVFMEIGLQSFSTKLIDWYYSRERERYLFSSESYLRQMRGTWTCDTTFSAKLATIWNVQKYYLSSRGRTIPFTRHAGIDDEDIATVLEKKGKFYFNKYGYCPFSNRVNDEFLVSDSAYDFLKMRIRNFYSDYKVLVRNDAENKQLIQLYKKVTRELDRKGITLIYVVPHFGIYPIVKKESVGGLLNGLDNIINLSDFPDSNENERLNLMYDDTHFNREGSRRFSLYFSKKLLEYRKHNR